jgi:hypothetical protein
MWFIPTKTHVEELLEMVTHTCNPSQGEDIGRGSQSVLAKAKRDKLSEKITKVKKS